MQRILSLLIFVLLLFFTFKPVFSSNKSEIYNAYITRRMDNWKDLIDSLENNKSKESDLLLELINYQYGYIGYCLEQKNYDEVRNYLRIAEKNIDILEKRNYNLSTIYAYKCAFYGFRISINNLAAPIYGKKSIELARSAITLDHENYFACIQYGNILFYMPVAFGGSKTEGIKYFIRAREILENNPNETTENWNYLNLLVLIGQSYFVIHEYESARTVYDYILKIEPDFLYVREELYPELMRTLKK